MRDRGRGSFRKAVELSLLLHLLLVFLIAPRLEQAWSAVAADAVPLVPAARPAPPPLEFELVDLPNQREEKPPEDRPARLSDMDRRAHGGEGDEAASPGVTGSTPQLVQADGGQLLDRGVPPSRQGVPQPQVPPPSRDEREPDRRPRPDPSRPEGAGEPEPRPETTAPSVPLPPPGAVVLPPDIGGLAQSPDRRGGQVDAGGLSFDTQWYDWGPYAAKMLRKIRRNWRIPEIARLGVQGRVKIRFLIERDGTVTGMQILDESGKPPMDFAARDAIAISSPFDPLPSDLTGVDREGVTITFYYNTRREDW